MSGESAYLELPSVGCLEVDLSAQDVPSAWNVMGSDWTDIQREEFEGGEMAFSWTPQTDADLYAFLEGGELVREDWDLVGQWICNLGNQGFAVVPDLDTPWGSGHLFTQVQADPDGFSGGWGWGWASVSIGCGGAS